MENLRSKSRMTARMHNTALIWTVWTVYAGTDASSVEIEATDLVQPIDRVE